MKKLCLVLIILLLTISEAFPAINFNGTNQNLSSTTLPFTAAPFTVCLWFRSENDTANKQLFSIAVSGADTNNFEMQAAGGQAGDPIRYFIRAASGDTLVATTTGFTINTYHSACIVEASATDHKVYIDGNSVGSSTTSRVPSGLNLLQIGDRAGSATSPFDGDIAEVAVWSIALSAADIASLHDNAYEATCIQSGSLTHYWPLADNTDLTDSISSVVLTANGTPTSSTHPTINSCATITPGVLDTFTGANGTDLDAHDATWSDEIRDSANYEIEIQGFAAAKQPGAEYPWHVWLETMPSADGSVSVDVPSAGNETASYFCIYARLTTAVISTIDGYGACIDFDWSAGAERISVVERTDGAGVGVLASVNEELTVPFTLRLTVDGADIKALINDVLKVSYTDVTAPIYSAAGYIGLEMGSD